jgi:uncharacterized membrane protein YkoI
MMKSALYVLGLLLACLPMRHSPEKLLKEATVSLPEAVEKALPEIKEGSAVTARLKEDKGRVLYVVSVAQGEGAVRLSIDAKTKEIVEKASLKKNYAKLIGASKVTLAKAVEAAILKVPGKATRVHFELKKGKPVAEVIVFKDGKSFEVKLDAVTGSVIKVEEDDDDDDDGDDDDDDEGDDD